MGFYPNKGEDYCIAILRHVKSH